MKTAFQKTKVSINNLLVSFLLGVFVLAGFSLLSSCSSGDTAVPSATTRTLEKIQITANNYIIPVDTAEQFTATGIYSDNTSQDLTEQVTWQVESGNIAEVNESGTSGLVMGMNAGKTTLTAIFGGIVATTPITVNTALLQSIQITHDNVNTPLGMREEYTAVGIYSDKSHRNLTNQVFWQSTNKDIATISNDIDSVGQATALRAGSTTIRASKGMVMGSAQINVTTATLQSIHVTHDNLNTPSGFREQFKAIGIYSDKSKRDLTNQVNWKSSNNSIAVIDNRDTRLLATTTNGVTIKKVSGLATTGVAGTATISAEMGSVIGSAKLQVTTATLLSISITPLNPDIPFGLNEQFIATGTYSDNSSRDITNQVTWQSSAVDVATISNASGSAGLLITVGLGSTTISASLGSVNSSRNLTVITTAHLESIQITPSNLSTPVGISEQFTATGIFSDNSHINLTSQVTWQSSNSAIATISNAANTQGLVTTVAVGTSTISASLGGVNASTTLTVTAATLQSIQITPGNPNIPVGLTEQLTATGVYSDNSSKNLTSQVTWQSSNSAIATISNAANTQGLVTTVAAGTSTISASLGSVSASTTLTVTAATLQSIQITPSNPSTPVGLTEQLTATGVYSDNSSKNLTSQVTWQSSNSAIATIGNAANTQGLVTTVAVGASTISASLGGVSASTTLTVTAATLQSIQITPSNPNNPAGLPVQLTATGVYSDNSSKNLTSQVTWQSSNSAVATISNAANTQGLVTTVAVGTSTISASLGGVSASTTLTVTAATLVSMSITEPTGGVIATPTTIVVTGIYSDNSQKDVTSLVTWLSSDPSCMTININDDGYKLYPKCYIGGDITITASIGTITAIATYFQAL